MVTFITTILCCLPVIVGIAGGLYFVKQRRQEAEDEKEYLNTLTEDEKNMYFKEKNDAYLKQHKAYSINGVATMQRNR